MRARARRGAKHGPFTTTVADGRRCEFRIVANDESTRVVGVGFMIVLFVRGQRKTAGREALTVEVNESGLYVIGPSQGRGRALWWFDGGGGLVHEMRRGLAKRPEPQGFVLPPQGRRGAVAAGVAVKEAGEGGPQELAEGRGRGTDDLQVGLDADPDHGACGLPRGVAAEEHGEQVYKPHNGRDEGPVFEMSVKSSMSTYPRALGTVPMGLGRPTMIRE